MVETYIFACSTLAQEFEELQFTQGAQTKHGMVEGCDAFNGYFALSGLVYGGAGRQRAADTIALSWLSIA